MQRGSRTFSPPTYSPKARLWTVESRKFFALFLLLISAIFTSQLLIRYEDAYSCAGNNKQGYPSWPGARRQQSLVDSLVTLLATALGVSLKVWKDKWHGTATKGIWENRGLFQRSDDSYALRRRRSKYFAEDIFSAAEYLCTTTSSALHSTLQEPTVIQPAAFPAFDMVSLHSANLLSKMGLHPAETCNLVSRFGSSHDWKVRPRSYNHQIDKCWEPYCSCVHARSSTGKVPQ